MSYYLTVENLQTGEKVYPVVDRVTLGRGPDSLLRLDDPSVSRRHAVVFFRHGHIMLEDQGSTNGTFVNGERIDKAELKNGDRLRLGRVYVRVIEAEYGLDTAIENETIITAVPRKRGEYDLHGELQRLSREGLERVKAMEHELAKGAQVQREFLPKHMPTLPGWEIATCFEPAQRVAGDFYDSFLLPDGQLGFTMADVCGKGVGAGLFMSLTRGLIRAFSMQAQQERLSDDESNGEPWPSIDYAKRSDRQPPGPFEAVALTNDYIAREHGEVCVFITLFFGVLDPVTGKLAYANAGHEPAVIIRGSGGMDMLESLGPPLGLFSGIDIKVAQTLLNPGDTLFCYTDGVTEARGADGDLFSKRRLLALLEQPPQSAQALLDRIKRAVLAHSLNTVPSDDITMMAIRRAPSESG